MTTPLRPQILVDPEFKFEGKNAGRRIYANNSRPLGQHFEEGTCALGMGEGGTVRILYCCLYLYIVVQWNIYINQNSTFSGALEHLKLNKLILWQHITSGFYIHSGFFCGEGVGQGGHFTLSFCSRKAEKD